MIKTPDILEPVSISQVQETRGPYTAEVLSKLEMYASAEDLQGFVSFVKSIDWMEHSSQTIL